MTNRAKLTGTAAIFAALLSAPAFAAGAGADASGNASVDAGGASVSADAGGSMGADVGTDSGSTMGSATADAGSSLGADVGDDGASADAGTNLTAEAGNSGKAKTGAMAGEMTYGNLISSYRSGSDFAATVEGADEDVTVQTMTLSELKGEAGENAEALDQAMADAGDQMDALHSAIEANSEVTAALDAEGYTADDVVAVQSGANGELQVIVDDRM